MPNEPTTLSEYDAIVNVVQHYIDGAKSGRGDDMKPAFHEDATMWDAAELLGIKPSTLPSRIKKLGIARGD